MHHVLRAFFQNARKPGGLSGRIMLWAMNCGHASLAKWGRSHVSPEPDARVLDIGCGGGANLAQFLKLCSQGSVCGIDFSAESVATSLRKNAGAVAAGRCEVRQGDVSRPAGEVKNQRTVRYTVLPEPRRNKSRVSKVVDMRIQPVVISGKRGILGVHFLRSRRRRISA